MKTQIVSYKRKGSHFVLGFYAVKTTEEKAIEKAKENYKNDFYQGYKEAEKIILELDFYIDN
jgi:hypothetical protein